MGRMALQAARRGARLARGLAWMFAAAVLLSRVWSGPAVAVDIDASWRMVDESGQEVAISQTQARASIYRGSHLLALRCHSNPGHRWTSLVISATWFVHPKERPRFTIVVDGDEPFELTFQRETDYRFVSLEPPRALLEDLAAGREATIEGPDYEGRPVVLPLRGSRNAIERALSLCGIDPPPTE